MKTQVKRLLVMLALLAGIQLAGAQPTFIPLYSFTGGNDGENPIAGLVQANDGNLYGTTSYGGTNFDGTIFRITTNGVLTPLYSFTGGHDGAEPRGGLVQASDGYLYGTTANGGTNDDGTVFRITTNGVLTPLYSFTGNHDGTFPEATLVQASDGYLYGTAYQGGISNNVSGYGAVFRITTNGALTALYSFTNGHDGAYPAAGLMQANDGNLYGATEDGGTNGYGVVFRIATNDIFTPLYSFTEGHDGAYPEATLVQANDGNLYGTTYEGGTNSYGAVFGITTNGVLTPLYSFTDGHDGANPFAGLAQANNGNLYGTAAGGGTNDDGTVFEFALPSLSSPALSILSDSNQIVLSWPAWASNYVLQSTTNLASPNWVIVSNAISGMAVTNSLPAQYFRLANP
jgi:uncharacterized repeat protein (TIGR03803 family)